MKLEEWEQERAELLSKLAGKYGGIPAGGDLNVEETWRREFATHTEIKLRYDGDPGERIPAYLLLPRTEASPPYPAVFAAHQCAWQCDLGKEQVVGKSVDWSDQAYGLELVREGFVVLAPDANKVGERYDPKLRQPWETAGVHLKDQSRCCTAPYGSWGPHGWKKVFDVRRGFDLLSEHPLVDPDRIGMIGHSLGADTIIWAMPFEPRLRAAAISGGGLMMYKIFPYGLPYEDILRLIAPRPFFEVTGAWDEVNWKERPKPETVEAAFAQKRAALAKAKATYALYGKPERLDWFEFEGGHEFPKEGRRAAYDWLKRWL